MYPCILNAKTVASREDNNGNRGTKEGDGQNKEENDVRDGDNLLTDFGGGGTDESDQDDGASGNVEVYEGLVTLGANGKEFLILLNRGNHNHTNTNQKQQHGEGHNDDAAAVMSLGLFAVVAEASVGAAGPSIGGASHLFVLESAALLLGARAGEGGDVVIGVVIVRTTHFNCASDTV